MSQVKLSFHGAARTVTGSRYLLQHGKRKTLIDCGLFQGYKELREMNWREPPFDPREVDQIVLTHSHIDHIGAIPRFVKQGFNGPIYCTSSSKELARLLLLDSAKIHEEDARWANKRGHSKHKPALPLYDSSDAKRALRLFKKVDWRRWHDLGEGARVRWSPAGHILGSSHLEFEVPRGLRGEGVGTIVFSGDIGRYDMPLHADPKPRPYADVLICESTYGGRNHDTAVPVEVQLRDFVLDAIERKAVVLIPAFAVGRSQQLTLILRNLIKEGELPDVPIHLDSPMAVDATRIYSRHLDEHQLDGDVVDDGRSQLFPNNVTLHKSVKQSKELNRARGPRVIISASGMLTGGRVLHHLTRLLPDRNNLILMAGYQAGGTRGRRLLNGERHIRVHGHDVPVRAQVASLSGLSAHADQNELIRWMRSHDNRPKMTFLTHGEPEASFELQRHLRHGLGWRVEVPELDEAFDLDPYFGL